MSWGLYRTPAPTPVRISSRLNPGAGDRRGNHHSRGGEQKGGGRNSRWASAPQGPSEQRPSPQAPRGRRLRPRGALLGEGAGAASATDGAGRRQRRGRRGGQARPSSWAAQLTSAPGLRSQSGQDPSQLGRGDPHTLQPLRHLRGGCSQLLRLRHRRAQPGNHDGRAARAHPLPPFSPPPPVALPQTTVAALGAKASGTSNEGHAGACARPRGDGVCACACAEV